MSLFEIHEESLRTVGQLVHQVREDQWDEPTSCTGWSVRNLVNHLVCEQLWVPHVLAGRTLGEVGDRYDGDMLSDDPVGAWVRSSAAAHGTHRSCRTGTPAPRGCKDAMKAATVTSFGSPPGVAELLAPAAVDEHDLLLDVLAAGLHPVVRAQADGSHYASPRALPFVPGVDGVGRDADGGLRYFVLLGAGGGGAMAERVVVDARHTVLPSTPIP